MEPESVYNPNNDNGLSKPENSPGLPGLNPTPKIGDQPPHTQTPLAPPSFSTPDTPIPPDLQRFVIPPAPTAPAPTPATAPVATQEMSKPEGNGSGSGIKNPFKRLGLSWDWREFLIYGVIWLLIFGAGYSVYKVGATIVEQQRIIRNLIDRLNGDEDGDYYNDGDEQDKGDKNSPLGAWVKSNLPTKGVEERPAVAEVFGNLADMLDAGELKGEEDTFAEGVAQLQPVATRSIWLPFLTKLTKRLQKAKLDSAGLAEACRTISTAIYRPNKRPSALLVDSIAPTPVSNAQAAEPNPNTNEDENAPEAKPEAENEQKPADPQPTPARNYYRSQPAFPFGW